MNELKKGELIELRVLMLPSDLEYINHLIKQNNVSQEELRTLGSILIQSMRSFCE